MAIADIKLDQWLTDAFFHSGLAPDMPDDIAPVVELSKTEVEMYPGLVRRTILHAYYLADFSSFSAL